MEVKFSESYDSVRMAAIISRALTELELKLKSVTQLPTVTSDDIEPPDLLEKTFRIHRDEDGTTKKIIIRDEGKNYSLTLTEIT